MKSFYEMLRILESEQVKTLGGYTLTPEELEEYENERSPMYKALFLKDIDAKIRAEEERTPENIAAKERKKLIVSPPSPVAAFGRSEMIDKPYGVLPGGYENTVDTKSPIQKYDYVIKASGLLLNELPNQAIEGVMSSVGIKKENSNWTVKTQIGNFPVVPYDGTMEKPKHERDYDFVVHLLDLLVMNWNDNLHKEDRKSIENVFKKIGVEKTGEIGEELNFDGIYHDTRSPVEVGQKVIVILPGFAFETPKGSMLLIKSKVQPS